MLAVKLILEGLGLGAILILICWAGIRRGAVGMAQLYHRDVQERCVTLGLTTWERIRRRAAMVRLISMTIYLVYVLLCVYVINCVRGFGQGFLQIFVILSIMNLIDRFLIDEYWVGHTKMWVIPGTEDLMPYITREDKQKKWLMGTVGMAVFAAILAGVMCLFVH